MNAGIDQDEASVIDAAVAVQEGVYLAWPAVEGWDGLLRAGLLRRAGLLPRTRDGEAMVMVIGTSRDREDARALGCGEVMLIDGCGGRRREIAKRLRRVTTSLDVPLVIGDAMMVLAMASVDCQSRLMQIEPSLMRRAMSLIGSDEEQAQERASQRASLELTDEELCVLHLTARAGSGDARMFTGLVGVMELDDHVVTGVTSDRAGRAGRCQRFSTAFRRWDVLLTSVPPCGLLAAADVVIVDRGEQRRQLGEGLDQGGFVAALRAMMMGKPVLMVKDDASSEWLGEPVQEAGGAERREGAEISLKSVDATLPELARVLVPLMRSRVLLEQAGAQCARRGAELMSEGAALEGW